MKMLRWHNMQCLGLLLWTVACGGDGSGPDSPAPGAATRSFQPLEFPFANPGDIVRMAAFGIPNWSGTEPHNGIDLQVSDSLESSRVVSPSAGDVVSITTSENPYSDPAGQLMLTVSIRVNDAWRVNLVLEPSTTDPALKDAQRAAVFVSEGQTVEAGMPVADLLVGSLGYPHLHYMVESNRQTVCAYRFSSPAAVAALDAAAALPDSSLPDGNVCYGEP